MTLNKTRGEKIYFKFKPLTFLLNDSSVDRDEGAASSVTRPEDVPTKSPRDAGQLCCDEAEGCTGLHDGPWAAWVAHWETVSCGQVAGQVGFQLELLDGTCEVKAYLFCSFMISINI